jgi:DNA-binding NtrC family response regulator
MTGDNLAREMLAIKPTIPIIICTGFSQQLNAEEARKIGIKTFLMKPVSLETLTCTIGDILDQT